ncbi:tetratricopeptide repeat-containing sensor histidine kinase [Spirosoma aerolatum]|uniref:tetratricopeptide repeat-containing sensor histidine kinase n=1 Tax=Spirosoma aerolatum TaxID=1211326 RepID=UPI001473452D|nr:tetratricopeptide repeat-containing sensor histidine kinase [Spirosoma aerolatum]
MKWFIWTFALLVTPGYSQTNLDSLQNALATVKHDSIRLKIYSQLIKGHLYAKPELAQVYASKFDSVATALQSEIDIAFGKNYLGMVRYVNNDYTKAISYYLEAIDRFEKLKIPLRVGIALNNIGACYQYREEPRQTIDYYQKALAIFQKLNETTWIGNVSHNIANEYFKLANQTTDQGRKLRLLNSVEFNEKVALHSFQLQKDSYSIGLAYIVLGNIKYEKKNLEGSIKDYLQAQKLIPYADDPVSIGIVNENIGNSLFELKRYDESIVRLEKAIQIFKAVKALPNLTKSLDVLARAYSAKKDYKRAFGIQREFVTQSDNLFNQEKDKAMLDVLKKYESAKKEQENQLLNQQLKQEQQQRLAYGVGLVGLLLFSGIIGYFLVKNRQKNRLIERQNQKLSELNREKNHLISMVSHDLNTPFLTIKTWNSLLKLNLQDNPKTTEAVQAIDKSAVQGMTLIKNILDVEKAETNQRTLTLQKIDLVELTKEVVDRLTLSAQAKNLTMYIESTDKKIAILTDKHLMIRVLENLLSNAIKYSYPGKKIWVGLESSLSKIRLTVKDEGVGIGSGDIPKLFTKYGVAASKPTSGEHSTGLGLHIVKRILDEIGGEIQCQSEVRKGTTFTVTLEA